MEAYARPGVAPACLMLQDRHAQNVPLLLWAVWARAGDAASIERATALARTWEEGVVAPLRAARRSLKAPAPPVDDVVREALREAVKAAELRAERVLLETLEGLPGDSAASASALEALRAVSAAWGPPPAPAHPNNSNPRKRQPT